MTVTFCGHSKVADSGKIKEWLYTTVEDLIKQGAVTFYLGGYGAFDELAASVVRELKKTHPHIESVLVLPYLDRAFNTTLYDTTVYPPLENTPKRFCIVKRNRYMVENADVIVSYITHDFGGAYKTYEHAIKKGKQIINYM